MKLTTGQRTQQRHRVDSQTGVYLLFAAILLEILCSASFAQYPPPLVHTPTNHPAARVLILSVDQMHALDLSRYVAANPRSALAELAARGVSYTNAYVPWPDPAAGLVSLVTGGTPISTGILSIDGYDRALSPPGSDCSRLGTAIPLTSRELPGNAAEITQRRTESSPAQSLDPAALPRDPAHGCRPVPPHALLRVNNIFEAVRAHGGRTAWAGETAALTDLLEGPSGDGLDEACGYSPKTTHDVATANELRVEDVLHWISGHDCSGAKPSPVPELFGMSFAETLLPAGGQASAPPPWLAKVDLSIARIVDALKRAGLYDSTWIVVTSPYGRSPLDPTVTPALRRAVPGAATAAVAEAAGPGLVRHLALGRLALLWLSDPAKAPALAQAYARRSAALHIAEIYTADQIMLRFNSPRMDSRMPDLILVPRDGVVWTEGKNGTGQLPAGFGEDEAHVPLLLSGAQLMRRLDKTLVPTSQAAPLIMRALGMEKFDLDALHREHTPALPGIF